VRIGASVGFVTSRIAFARGYLNSSAQPIDFAHLFVGIPQSQVEKKENGERDIDR
jgi:hypothetical protein